MRKTIDDMSPAEIAAGLKKAKALIDHPDKWVQYAFRDGDRICAHSALARAADTGRHFRAMVVAFLGKPIHEDNEVARSRVCGFNNLHTHEELMAHFDKAIARHSPKQTN